jgi:hypothetical protein
MRRSFLILAAFVVAASAGGCIVGDGSGYADGPLWILGCKEGKDLGTQAMPQLYHLSPTFFAAEPIEDITDATPTNRLIIRMQSNGNSIQIVDTLYFDVRDSTQVAKCLRGRTVAGVPDWDTSSGAVVNDLNDVPPADQPPWCEPPGTVAGVARIRLIPFGPVAVSFAPLGTCHSEMRAPAFVNITGVARDGWIDFEHFGAAIQGGQAMLASDARRSIDEQFSDGFRVNYDEALTATFHIDLDDERVAAALRDKKQPPTAPQIGGVLDGRFDFDFKRGRSAQTFP